MLKLALIDDRPTNRKLLSQLATHVDPNLELHSFEDGLEAITWVREGQTPDLVITDYNMPKMNGAEFIAAFREIERCRNIPVIALTAHEDKDYRINALEAGATDFLQRPIDHHEFQVRIRNLLTLREQQILIERNSERKLKTFLDAIPAMVCATDIDGNISFANKYMQDLLAIKESDCFNKDLDNLFEHSGFKRKFAQKFNESLNHNFEETITDPEGKNRTFLTTRVSLSEIHPSMDEDVLVSIDISERKNAERKFKHQGTYFHGIIDNDPNLIFAHNKDGLITIANKAFAKACGISQNELKGLSVYECKINFGKPQNKTIEEGVDDERQAETVKFMQPLTLPNGDNKWYQTVQTQISSLMSEESDGSFETLNVMSDITALIEQADELSAAKEEAESANWSKTEFLANMSHELRTPLNAIINFSEMMRQEILGPIQVPKYKEYAQDINDSGSHLLSIINDILDISKIESGQMHLHAEEHDMNEIIESVSRLLKHRLEAAELGYEVIYDDSAPKVKMDAVKIKQVLFNLVTNSIKFTPLQGKISVQVNHDAENLTVKVVDTGIGIRDEDIQKALKRFGQLESHLTRQHSGSGLGLSLVKSFIDMHHGSFSLESAVGEGTTVTFSIPLQQAVTKPAESTARPEREQAPQAAF